jgi:hypothetical protein
MEFFAPALSVGFVLAFLAFAMWLRQQRRVMVHRERIAALEKGIELQPIEVEARRIAWNVQRLLLLAGFVWISIGTGFYMVFSEMLRNPTEATRDVPHGIQYVGYGLIGVGVSHLIAYAAGLGRKES